MDNSGDGLPDAYLPHRSTLQEAQGDKNDSEQVDGNDNGNSDSNSMTVQAPVSEHAEHAEEDDVKYEPGAIAKGERDGTGDDGQGNGNENMDVDADDTNNNRGDESAMVEDGSPADNDTNSFNSQPPNEIHSPTHTARSPRHDPDSLFVPERSPTPPGSLNQQDDVFDEPFQEHEDQIDYSRQLEAGNSEHLFSGDEVDLESTVATKATRKRKRVRDDEEQLSEHDSEESSIGEPDQSMQDAELESMRVGLELQADRRKRQHTSAPSKPRKREKKAASKISRGEKRRLNNAKKKKDKEMEHAAKQAGSLFSSNVFNQQAGPDAPEQPTYMSKIRKDALKDVVENLPPEIRKEGRVDRANLNRAVQKFDGGRAIQVHPNNPGQWILRDFKTPLKNHQVFGVSFMRQRENSKTEPKGGLLADQMGLGKTVMMLANMTNGRPKQNSRSPKTTLIVASPAILTQWQDEIERHSNFNWLRYGAGTRVHSSNKIETLLVNDIILTTYNEIMSSYPKFDPPKHCKTDGEKEQWWEEAYEKRRGVLHRIKFHRIVLDEAQAIKNHNSRTSLACRALMAKYRWAVSGTPIQNSLTELYPYFKFIGVPGTGDFATFKAQFCNPKNPEKLLHQLGRFMIRRTHEDKIFGAPILKLPEAGQTTFWCEFNSVERCVYEIVRARFIERINAWSRDGKLNKSYSNILVLLLRLRQLAAHILMLQFVMRDLLEREDIERIQNVVNTQVADGRNENTIIAVREQLKKLADEEKKKPKDVEVKETDVDDSEKGEKADEESGLTQSETPQSQTTQFEAGGDFGQIYNFKPYLKSLKKGKSWDKARKNAKCSKCSEKPKTPMITSCGHIHCTECYSNAFLESAERGEEEAPCARCGTIPDFVHPCDPEETATKKGRRRVEDDKLAHDWLSGMGNDVLSSAKTIAIKSQIMNWLQEHPDVKIIVYTQFLAMIQIMAQVCEKEGWKAEQYHGKMSLEARDEAIRTFAREPESRVLLASLQCGGLGLNLTMASKVIIIDPWWNTAAEQQAFCRVFRIGQDQKTFMVRLCVQDSVDEKIIKIQERKDWEIKQVMGVEKRDSGYLMEMFGDVRQDAEGNSYIVNGDTDAGDGLGGDGRDEGDSSDDF